MPRKFKDGDEVIWDGGKMVVITFNRPDWYEISPDAKGLATIWVRTRELEPVSKEGGSGNP